MMMDDIVKWLREEAEGWEPEQDDLASPTAKKLRDAADEIERLRAALLNVTDALEMLQGNEWETIKRARAALKGGE